MLASAQKLGFGNRQIHYYPHHFIGGTIRNLEFSFCLCFSYARSHQGFTSASIWYLRCKPEEAAEQEHLDDQLDAATAMTPEDHARRGGKPGLSPKGLTELIEALELWLVHLHAGYGLQGDHQKCVNDIWATLRNVYDGHISLSQRQVDDNFWSVFIDGRLHAKQDPANWAMYWSTLHGLAMGLRSRVLPPCVGVPYSKLSPTSVATKRTAEDAGWSVPSGRAGNGGRGSGNVGGSAVSLRRSGRRQEPTARCSTTIRSWRSSGRRQ